MSQFLIRNTQGIVFEGQLIHVVHAIRYMLLLYSAPFDLIVNTNNHAAEQGYTICEDIY